MKDRVRPGDFERRVRFEEKTTEQRDERAGVTLGSAPSMKPEDQTWRASFLAGDGRFRWSCACSTCVAECNAYLRASLAEALFGWLR